MVLVDTSIWVRHLRDSHDRLIELLEESRVLIHPFIIGELACGNMRNRIKILELLSDLPASTVADHNEIILFIDKNRLTCKGLGYVDVHLLASAILTDVCLWTDDKPLTRAAKEMGIGF
jgi:predicted nucleic acid-binding protein